MSDYNPHDDEWETVLHTAGTGQPGTQVVQFDTYRRGEYRVQFRPFPEPEPEPEPEYVVFQKVTIDEGDFHIGSIPIPLDETHVLIEAPDHKAIEKDNLDDYV